MTVLVPFDGSPLAETALARAAEVGDCRGEDVVVVTVIPARGDYAREQGWVEDAGRPDPAAIADRLRRQVRALAPDAEFRSQRVNARIDRPEIARRLRAVAEDVGASTVFLGSENVGRIAKPISSIGSNVAARTDYDIYLVQQPDSEHAGE